MTREIAVLVGTAGGTISLYEPGVLEVYQKKQRVWQIVRKIEYALDRNQGLVALRKQIETIIAWLGDCRIIVGSEFSGVPYYELEKAGFSVWEFSGDRLGLLDYVYDQEEQALLAQVAQPQQNIIPLPQDLGNGCYRISIKEIQENGGGISSKQVLLPFMRQRKFYSFEVICGHVPPWLEGELATSGMEYTVEKVENNVMKVTIVRKMCRAES